MVLWGATSAWLFGGYLVAAAMMIIDGVVLDDQSDVLILRYRYFEHAELLVIDEPDTYVQTGVCRMRTSARRHGVNFRLPLTRRAQSNKQGRVPTSCP